MEIPKAFIPDTRNYEQEIADRMAGQDRVLEKMTDWAQQTIQLLAMLTKQQAEQQKLINTLAQQLADLKQQR